MGARPSESTIGVVEIAALRVGAHVMGALPDHLGQFRVAQRYWWRRRPGHQLLKQQLVDGTRLELDLGDRTQALAYLTRRYSEDVVGRIVARLPQNGLFFDVGANVGLITFQIAHRRPDVRIVGFEPNPAAVEAWQRNHRLCEAAAVALEATAVADRLGVVNLVSPTTDLGAGRLTPDAAGVEVPVTTLDSYCAEHAIDRVDVMKLDVEGFEPEALSGARELLMSGSIRAVIVEFNDGYFASRGRSRQALIEWLGKQGMSPVDSVDADDVMFVTRQVPRTSMDAAG